MNERVLIIEDEPGLARSLVDRLVAEGYRVDHVGDGPAGLDQARRNVHDVVVLDVMLPRMQGFEVCRLMRQEGILTPVLMLTARSHVADKVSGLRLGADDYLTKPFEMVELLARIEALLRRRRETVDPPSVSSRAVARDAEMPDVYEFGDVRVDVRRAEVVRNGEPVELSSREFRLLVYLLAHGGRTVDRDTLLQDVWGYDEAPLTRTVDVHIAQLRNKIEANPSKPQFIVTVHGTGYKFAEGNGGMRESTGEWENGGIGE